MGDILQERIDKVFTNVNNLAETFKILDDANNRFQMFPGGKMEWGGGSTTPDTNLYRSAANTLKTDDTFVANILKSGSVFLPVKVAKVAFGADELGGSETNTSFTFPASGALALYSWIEVTDAESGTMDVGTQGTSNDPDGLLDGISLASTGVIVPNVTFTTGLNATYISANTFGALTHTINAGTDAAGDEGGVVWAPKFITGADPVSITSSGDLDSCSGNLFIAYIDLADFA